MTPEQIQRMVMEHMKKFLSDQNVHGYTQGHPQVKNEGKPNKSTEDHHEVKEEKKKDILVEEMPIIEKSSIRDQSVHEEVIPDVHNIVSYDQNKSQPLVFLFCFLCLLFEEV